MTETNYKIIFTEKETGTLNRLKELFNKNTKSAVIRKLLILAEEKYL